MNYYEDAPGKRVLLLGNESIARGAVEAGIQVVRDQLGKSDSKESRATLFVVPVQRFEQV